MGVKLGTLDISAFKVGSGDCKVYLGDTLLYPQSQPQTLQWVSFSAGDAAPRGDVYGIKVSGATAFPSIIDDNSDFIFKNGSNDLDVYNGPRGRWYYDSNSCGIYDVQLGSKNDNWELMFNTVCGVDYYLVRAPEITVIPYDCQLYIYA